MKTTILSIFFVALSLFGFAQNRFKVQNVAGPTQPAFMAPAIPTHGHSRSGTAVRVNNYLLDSLATAYYGGSFFTNGWALNKNFPDNSSNSGNLNYAVTQIDTVIDLISGQPYSVAGTNFTLDSIYIPFAYNRVVTTAHDTAIIKVYSTPSGLTLNPSTVLGTISNTVLFTQKVALTTSTTGAYLVARPNLSFPTGGKFAIGIDFVGDVTNFFNIIGGGGDFCNAGCWVEPQIIPGSSNYKCILWNQAGTSDYSFTTILTTPYNDCDTSNSYTPGGCELFYLQDIDLNAFLTFNTSSVLTASISGNTSICSGQSTTLTANGTGGTTPYTYHWSTGSNSQTASVTTSGTVTVTITDANSQTATASVTTTVQNCSSVCTANANYTQPGIWPVSDSIPCIAQNTAYNATLTFRNFTSVNLGVSLPVDSARLDSIGNLPCGITWTTNKAPGNTFAGGELGCIQLSGTTTDAVGQYKLEFYFTGYSNGFPPTTITGSMLGLRKDLRVKASSGSSCAAVDTNQTGLTSSGHTCVSTPPSVTISGNTTFCTGQNTTLTANATGGNGSYTYHWSNNATTQSTTVTTAGTYTVTVTSNSQTATASVTVTTQSSVVPSVSIISNPASVCAGQAATFIAAPTNGGNTPTYAWYVNTTPVGAGSTYTTSTLAPGDVVKVVLTSSSSCAAPTTATSNTITAQNCGAVCTANANFTQPGLWPVSDSIPCIAQNTAYSTTLTIRNYTTFTYPGVGTIALDSLRIDSISNLPCGITWTTNKAPGNTYAAGELGCIQLSGTTTDAVGQYKLHIVVTAYAFGSSIPGVDISTLGIRKDLRVKATVGSACAAVDTNQLSLTSSGINCIVTPPSVSISGNTTFCTGQSTILTANATGGNGSYTYHWSNNATTQSITVSAAGTYSVTVTSNSQTATASVTVTTQSSVVPSVSITSNPASVCAGQSATFTASPTNGGNTPTYAWYVNTTQVSTGSTYTTATLNAGDVVKVVLTSSLSCAAPTTATSNTITAQNCGSVCTPDPNVTQPGVYAPNGQVPCIVQNVAYSSTLTIMNYTTFSFAGQTLVMDSLRIDSITNLPCGIAWITNKTPGNTYAAGEVGCIKLYGTSTDAVGQYQLHIVVTAYIHGLGPIQTSLAALGYRFDVIVKATPAAPCPAVDTTITGLTSSGINCVIQPPSVSISGTTTFCTGQSTTLTANATGGNGSYTYHWSNNATTQSITVSTAGTYTVTVTSNSQTATASVTVTTQSAVVPTVSITSNPSQVCAGASATFTATNTNGGNSPIYTWYVNTTPVATGATYTTSTLLTGDVVKAVLTSSLSCASPTTATSNTITAQNCGSVCTPDPNVTQPGIYPSSQNIPCIVQNVAYNTTLTIMNFDTVRYNGILVHVDSLRIDTIGNLPCGIAWTCNKAPSNVYARNEVGCIKLFGTSTDAVGQYKLNIAVTAYIGGAAIPVNAASLGLRYDLRLKATTGATCPNVDTTISGLTSSGINCTTQPVTVTISGNTNICAGNSTQLTANASGGNGSFTYHWSNNATTASINVTTGGTYTVTVTSAGLSATASTTVTVNPIPTTSVSLSVNPTPPCAGQTLTFVASPTNGGNSPSYLWFVNNNALSGPSGNTYSASNLVAGDVVKVVMFSSLPCASTQGATSNSITVLQSCAGTLSLSVTGNTIVCSGQTTQLTANAVGGSGLYTYNWSPSTGLSCTTCASPVVTVTTSTTYSVTVSDGSTSQSTQATVTILPAPTITVTDNPNPPCSSQTNIFTATATNAGGNPSITWYLNGVQVSTGTTFASSNLQTADQVYAVVSPSNGCSIATSSIQFVTPCNGALSVFISNNDTVCSGESTIITAQGSGGNGNFTYAWSPSAGLSSTSLAAPIATPTATTTYTVTVSDGSSTVTASVTVRVDPLPNASAGSDVTICSGGSATLHGSGGGANATYEWSPSTGLSCTNCQNTVATPASTSTYNVLVTDGNCSASAQVNMTVASSANASVSIVSTPDPACAGTNDEFVALPVNGGTGASYQWSLNGNTVGSNNDSIALPNLNVGDAVSCQMTSTLSCVQNATVTSNTITVQLCTGIEEFTTLDESVKVYPNPNDGRFVLDVDRGYSQMTIEIMNIEGMRIHFEQLKDTQAGKRSFDMNMLAKGVYLMRVSTEQGTTIKRLVIQ